MTNLSEEDFQQVVNEEYDHGSTVGLMLQMGRDFTFSSPDAIFTPTHVTILILKNGLPGIRKSLRAIQRQPGEVGMASEDPRVVAFSINNNLQHQKLLQTNHRLKLERKKLDDIQDIIESVEISDGDGNTCCKLMSSGIRLDDGGLSVLLSCNFIDMSNLHEMGLSVSGVRLREGEGSFSPYRSEMGSQIYIEYDTGITVIGFLDIAREMTEEELRVVNEQVLPSILQNILNGEPVRLRFPPGAFCLRSVHFNKSCVDTLGKIHALLPTKMLNLSL